MTPDTPAVQPEASRSRPRTVLYTCVGIAVVLAALIAVLASSSSASQRTGSSPLVGKPAPPVSGPSLTGGATYSLAQFAGEWVLVNFSASWCVPCRQETPQLLQFQKEHAGPSADSRTATILAVSFDPSDKANLAAFLRSSSASWPAVDDASAEVAYGVTGIPESYLVDPRGLVVAKFVGGVTAAQVDAVMRQGAPA
jgi:cytochrome c biogenesis protein CcmG/thiol:disulfide interchange protein DsbE